ncbi:aminoglycoside phosphotransferase family protein [Streptomyces kronopolitis]|uniref:aminoglycoside phosphotransferase family protein n=1 Tax=Streptomyces kronopolitis TaxID=1612435 RepID=UPI00341D59E7
MRIARSTEYLDSARGEVQVSRWLSHEGFPVTRVVDDLEQPMVVDGHPVTFWHLIEEGARKATYGELGAVLRDLHSLSLPDTLNLPPYPVLDRTDRRINAAVDIPEDDRAFLRKRACELRDRVADLRFESEKGPVHGDAHVQNLMVDRNDQVILIDLERFSSDHWPGFWSVSPGERSSETARGTQHGSGALSRMNSLLGECVRGTAIGRGDRSQAVRKPQVVPLVETQICAATQQPDVLELEVQYCITRDPVQ